MVMVFAAELLGEVGAAAVISMMWVLVSEILIMLTAMMMAVAAEASAEAAAAAAVSMLVVLVSEIVIALMG